MWINGKAIHLQEVIYGVVLFEEIRIKMLDIILASASPRRKELLSNMGIDFSVIVANADETAVDKSVPPQIYVEELAFIKAVAVAEQVKKNNNSLIIAADTVVINNGRILGKPSDEQEAFEILQGLSGKSHEVYTGVCVMRTEDAYTVCRHACTSVTFKRLSDDKIRNYINTGEPMDKAGAYGIQRLGAMFVEKINGDYFNVVGLPVSMLAEVLENEFNYKLI